MSVFDTQKKKVYLLYRQDTHKRYQNNYFWGEKATILMGNQPEIEFRRMPTLMMGK